MKAIVVGPGEALALEEVADPVAREGDLLVDVKAAGVNRADLLQRKGQYAPPPGESEIMGLEIAGVVTKAAGAFREGDRVMALLAGGGYATKARVPAAQAMPIPQSLDFAQAAGIPEAFLTAWLNLFMLANLKPGEDVLVHAGASGVGSAALQLCRGVANRIVATASRSKHEACRALGATDVLDRGAQELPPADVIFDLVGADYFEADIKALKLHGRLLIISTMSGSKAQLDLNAMLRKRLTLIGSTVRTRSAQQKAKLVKDFTERALPRFARGELKPVIARTFPLADAAKAHDALRQNEVVGKIVLIP